MAQEISIGLPGNQVMQRYLARRIYREIELRIVGSDGVAHVGFVTGFDETCIQMSTSPVAPGDEPRGVLVFWPLYSIEETGSRIDSLEAEHRISIRKFTSVLREQCEVIFRNNGHGSTPAPRPPRARQRTR